MFLDKFSHGVLLSLGDMKIIRKGIRRVFFNFYSYDDISFHRGRGLRFKGKGEGARLPSPCSFFLLPYSLVVAEGHLVITITLLHRNFYAKCEEDFNIKLHYIEYGESNVFQRKKES